MKEKHTREEKITIAAQAFQQALHDLSGIHPGPNVVVISLPQEVISFCKDPFTKRDHIKLADRTFDSLSRIASQSPEGIVRR